MVGRITVKRTPKRGGFGVLRRLKPFLKVICAGAFGYASASDSVVSHVFGASLFVLLFWPEEWS